MSKSIGNKLRISFVLALAALSTLVYQNCGTSTEVASSGADSTVQGTAVNCPIYNIPNCSADESIIFVENENGCSYPACEKEKRVNTCPIFAQPICDKNEELKLVQDSNGCDVPVCTARNCPIYAAPLCGSNEELVFKENANGCAQPVCVEVDRRVNCPVPPPTTCSSRESLVGTTDINGCLSYSCKEKTDYVCPLYNAPLCEGGEIQSELDENGCSVPVCVR